MVWMFLIPSRIHTTQSSSKKQKGDNHFCGLTPNNVGKAKKWCKQGGETSFSSIKNK